MSGIVATATFAPGSAWAAVHDHAARATCRSKGRSPSFSRSCRVRSTRSHPRPRQELRRPRRRPSHRGAAGALARAHAAQARHDRDRFDCSRAARAAVRRRRRRQVPGTSTCPAFGAVFLDLATAFVVGGGAVDATGVGSFSVPIPGDVALIGARVWVQAYAIDVSTGGGALSRGDHAGSLPALSAPIRLPRDYFRRRLRLRATLRAALRPAGRGGLVAASRSPERPRLDRLLGLEPVGDRVARGPVPRLEDAEGLAGDLVAGDGRRGVSVRDICGGRRAMGLLQEGHPIPHASGEKGRRGRTRPVCHNPGFDGRAPFRDRLRPFRARRPTRGGPGAGRVPDALGPGLGPHVLLPDRLPGDPAPADRVGRARAVRAQDGARLAQGRAPQRKARVRGVRPPARQRRDRLRRRPPGRGIAAGVGARVPAGVDARVAPGRGPRAAAGQVRARALRGRRTGSRASTSSRSAGSAAGT